MTIGEVAKLAGLRASAIRYYESEGLLAAPNRVSGRRVYGADVLQRLAVIGLSQQAGFTVAEIRALLNGFARRTPPSARWRALAAKKLEQVEEQLEETERMKRLLQLLLSCECPSLTDCASVLETSVRVSAR
jgi:MerR family redox-sensitive transcriptional activator SoxR